MRSWKHWFASAAVGACLLAPTDAAACHGEEGDGRTVICFTSLHAGLATLIFLPTDIAYGLDGKLLPTTWAWHQTLIGGAATIVGSGIGMGLAIDDSPNRGVDLLWGGGLMLLGGYYLTHGILGIMSGDPEDWPKEADTASIPFLTVAPVDGGAVAMIALSR